ncbi:MAG: iron sulfur cluster assembly protein (SufU) [uncultured bacterium]|nr:MAG: iron sulfur cluster assembly protein (SufU) [uncultured bacterium]
MSDLRELYQQVILDHSKKPQNRGFLEAGTHTAEGFNPLCGDKVKLYLKMKGDTVEEASFEGSGCAISTASVSMLTEIARGKTKSELIALFDKFHSLVTEGQLGEEGPDLDKLEVFQGVSEFPMRVKCATLAWHTLKAAFENKNEAVSTE